MTFGNVKTDYMLVAEYDPKRGWSAPEIKPYGHLSLDPASSCFQYCPNVFEGMKAYRGPDGTPRLFRPQKNMDRLSRSLQRAALPVSRSHFVVHILPTYESANQHQRPSSPHQTPHHARIPMDPRPAGLQPVHPSHRHRHARQPRRRRLRQRPPLRRRLPHRAVLPQPRQRQKGHILARRERARARLARGDRRVQTGAELRPGVHAADAGPGKGVRSDLVAAPPRRRKEDHGSGGDEFLCSHTEGRRRRRRGHARVGRDDPGRCDAGFVPVSHSRTLVCLEPVHDTRPVANYAHTYRRAGCCDVGSRAVGERGEAAGSLQRRDGCYRCACRQDRAGRFVARCAEGSRLGLPGR
ncbi:hypothetical protein AX14_001075 [Amanita brunnescens Koide BX004]|nr:hypothetical protein AX14_001075 [Amanita brunnescens Koide BX004]